MLLLHVGPHKTATTFIQQHFYASRDSFANLGWIYPELGISGMTGHHEIAHNSETFLAGEQSEAMRAVGDAAREAGSNIVLSAEGFCRWTPAKFERMAGLLGQKDVRLVFAVRDPFDVLYSYWAEEVKQGFSVSFADRFIENVTKSGRARLMNPMRDLAPHLASGFAKVSVMPYNVLMADNVDIYEHFCGAFMDLAAAPKGDNQPKNTAMPIELTEFLRLLTTIKSNGADHIGSQLRQRFNALTTPQERVKLGDLVREHGASARRVVALGGMEYVRKRLEMLVTQGLDGHWSYPVEGRPIHSTEKQEYVYYDSFRLWQVAPIREAVESLIERL